jgi:outer membrane protein TolC
MVTVYTWRGWGVFFLSVLVIGLFTGCVDQKREVQTYRDVLSDGFPRPKPLEPGETLTLERALVLANVDNEQIASQGETYLQSLINKNRAVAEFLPSVSFQPNFTIEQAPRGNASPVSPGAPSTSAGAAAATAGGFVQSGQVLHRFEAPVVGSLNLSYYSVPNLKSAEMTVIQQKQLLIDAQATILLNVAQTYYQILISEQQVAVLQDSLAVQEARVRDVQGRYKVHLALALEVSQTVSEEAATRVLLAQAQSDVRNGRRTLAIVVGVSQIDGPLVDETPVPDSLRAMQNYVDRALARRQDLLAAHAAVKAARYAVDAAIAEYYPSLSLNVAEFLYRENFSDASLWDAILVANLPIFSAGIIEADVRDAWSRLRQAALFESYLHRQIDQSVQIAYDNLVTSSRELVDLQREVQASSDAYEQSVQLEKNGLAIPLDVLTAQNTLLNAQLQYTDESFSRTIFYLDLIRAVGDLNPRTIEIIRGSTTHSTTAPAGPATMPSATDAVQ